MWNPFGFSLFFIYTFGVRALPSPAINESLLVDVERRDLYPFCSDVGSFRGDRGPLTPHAPTGTTADGKPYVLYQWTLREGHVTVHGPCKFMHLINGQWPPPEIVVEQGTVIKIELTNKLNNDPITLHAHGFDQKNTQWQDGPHSITQRCVSKCCTCESID